jgi:hypothetical protein
VRGKDEIRWERALFGCMTRTVRKWSVTYQGHLPLLPINEIDGVIFRVLDAQVNQDEHDLVPDHVRSHVEEVYGQFSVELEVRLSR